MSQRSLFLPRNILVPTDLGPVSTSALKYARFFHERFGSRVSVLYAEHLELPPYFSSGQLVDEQIQKTCRVEEIRFHGTAARTIADASNDVKPDLIVMGAERKKSKLGEIFSSTTSGVMQIAVGPLLVVPKSV